MHYIESLLVDWFDVSNRFLLTFPQKQIKELLSHLCKTEQKFKRLSIFQTGIPFRESPNIRLNGPGKRGGDQPPVNGVSYFLPFPSFVMLFLWRGKRRREKLENGSGGISHLTRPRRRRSLFGLSPPFSLEWVVRVISNYGRV